MVSESPAGCSRVVANGSEWTSEMEEEKLGGWVEKEENGSSEVLVDSLSAEDARRNYVVHQRTLGLIVIYTGLFA